MIPLGPSISSQKDSFNSLYMSENNYSHLFSENSANEYSYAISLATKAVLKFLEDNKKPSNGITPMELKNFFQKIDFNTPLSDYESLLNEVETLYTRNAIAFHLPQYMAHLNCPIVIPAVTAEILIAAINSSLDTWDQSAGGTLVEQRLIQWTCDEIGFDKTADGIFTSGGTQSNLMALLLARDHFSYEYLQHNIQQDGLPKEASRYKIFCSEMAHFSISRNTRLLGLGENSVVKINTDHRFRMDVFSLEKSINRELKQGNIPIAVVATAGTTDFGNIDPLEEISKIAKKYSLWYHIDAAYGGGLLLTSKYRSLLNGIELANSVTVDYHKSFFQPISSSAFLVRHKNSLQLINHHADYLNPKDEDTSYPNQVNKSLQTTRRFDALKLWFTLRLMGKEKLGSYIDTIIDTTKQAANLIGNDHEFELLNTSDISTLVFRYISHQVPYLELCEINQYIRQEILRKGDALISRTKINGKFYLKITLLNPLTTIEHIQQILQSIKKYGENYVKTVCIN